MADRIVHIIQGIYPDQKMQYGKLDITFYRDDVHKELHVANQTTINFNNAANPGTSATQFQVTSHYSDASNTYNPGGRLGQSMARLTW